MKHALLLLCATLALAGSTAHAAPKHHAKAKPHAPAPPAKAPAVQAAEAWLALTDSGQYDQSYQTAASAFKAQVTAAQWTQAMQQVRAPLGAVKTRTFATVKYTTTLPGAPTGEYAVIQYSTVFANRTSVETITPMRDTDGQWRVSGYLIR